MQVQRRSRKFCKLNIFVLGRISVQVCFFINYDASELNVTADKIFNIQFNIQYSNFTFLGGKSPLRFFMYFKTYDKS